MKVIKHLTRGGLDVTRNGNPYSDVRLNVQKSAEAIVPRSGMSLKEREYERSGKG